MRLITVTFPQYRNWRDESVETGSDVVVIPIKDP